MKPGAQLKFKAADWLRITGEERSMAVAVSLLLQEADAPHVQFTSSDTEMRFDVRHVYHRASQTEGPRLLNIMERLFFLYPAKNGADVWSFDAEGPHLVARRGVVDWPKALEDWGRVGAVGTNRTMAKVTL